MTSFQFELQIRNHMESLSMEGTRLKSIELFKSMQIVRVVVT